MDNQFNTLKRSYSDNYVQFKVTGNKKYENSYASAQQGLESIINQLKDQVDIQKQQISAFYKSGVEQKITDLEQRNRFLQRGILSEKDDITASGMRNVTSSISIQPWQYIVLGILSLTALGVSVL